MDGVPAMMTHDPMWGWIWMAVAALILLAGIARDE